MGPRKPLKRARAIEMRKRGYSYNEICRELKVAKSTCSIWLRNVKLDKKAIHRLVDRQDEGRRKAALTLRQYGEERDKYIREKVTKSLETFHFSPEVGKLLCSTLYWGEGAKTGSVLTFTNSDPNMVKVYMALLRTYFSLEKEKFSALLHLHSYHEVEKQKRFWSKVTGISAARISIYRKPNSGKNIREGYPGCIAIRYYDIRLVKEMKFLYISLIDKFGGVV